MNLNEIDVNKLDGWLTAKMLMRGLPPEVARRKLREYLDRWGISATDAELDAVLWGNK